MSPRVVPKGYVTIETAEKRLGLNRNSVFGLIAQNLLTVSVQPGGTAALVRERDVDRVLASYDMDARCELARRGRAQMIDEQIAELQPWCDWMLARGATPEDMREDCRKLVALLEERGDIEREQAAASTRLEQLGIEPEYREAARARIRRREQ